MSTLDSAHAEMTVTGLGGVIPAQKAELFIGNAGTAARFLTAFLTLGNGNYILDGDARMRERPIGDLVSALEQLGAKIVNLNTPQVRDHPLAPLNPSARPSKSSLPAYRVGGQKLLGIYPASSFPAC